MTVTIIATVFNEEKLLLADWFLLKMCVTNPARKAVQDMVNIQTCEFLRKEFLSQQSGVSRDSFSKTSGK